MSEVVVLRRHGLVGRLLRSHLGLRRLRRLLDSCVAPREEAGVANFDYDMVVLSWGFCGRVAALPALEKG
jgi:hypothetical protein